MFKELGSGQGPVYMHLANRLTSWCFSAIILTTFSVAGSIQVLSWESSLLEKTCSWLGIRAA
jgi:hypothetical protein